jgi:hypothetical protein
MYRNPQYAPQIRAKHSAAFAALDATLRLGDDFMAATRGQVQNTPTHAVVRTVFTRLYNLLAAATILLEEGYGIEAGALTRSFLEYVFDACYLVQQGGANPGALAQRFIDYQYVARYLTVKNAKDAGMTLRPREFQLAEQDCKQYWDSKYQWGKGANAYDWTGLKPQDKARAGGAEEVYLWFNHHFSGMVHSGPDSWRHQVAQEENTTAFCIGPQDTLITLPIPALASLFAQAMQQLAALLHLPDVERKAQETYQFIEEQVRIMNKTTSH